MTTDRDRTGQTENGAPTPEDMRLETLLRDMPRRRCPDRVRQNVLAQLREPLEVESAPAVAPRKAKIVSLRFGRRTLWALEAAAAVLFVAVAVKVYLDFGTRRAAGPEDLPKLATVTAEARKSGAAKDLADNIAAGKSGQKAGIEAPEKGGDDISDRGGVEAAKGAQPAPVPGAVSFDGRAVSLAKAPEQGQYRGVAIQPAQPAVQLQESVSETANVPTATPSPVVALRVEPPLPAKPEVTAKAATEEAKKAGVAMMDQTSVAAKAPTPQGPEIAERSHKTSITDQPAQVATDDFAARPGEPAAAAVAASETRDKKEGEQQAQARISAKRGVTPTTPAPADLAGYRRAGESVEARDLNGNGRLDTALSSSARPADEIGQSRALAAPAAAAAPALAPPPSGDVNFFAYENGALRQRQDVSKKGPTEAAGAFVAGNIYLVPSNLELLELETSPSLQEQIVGRNRISAIQPQRAFRQAQLREDRPTTWSLFVQNGVATFNGLIVQYGGEVTNTGEVVLMPGARQAAMIECSVPAVNSDDLVAAVNNKRILAALPPEESRERAQAPFGPQAQGAPPEVRERMRLFSEQTQARSQLRRLNQQELSNTRVAPYSNVFVQVAPADRVPPREQVFAVENQLIPPVTQMMGQSSQAGRATTGPSQVQGRFVVGMGGRLAVQRDVQQQVAGPATRAPDGFGLGTAGGRAGSTRLLYFVLEPDLPALQETPAVQSEASGKK